MRWQVKKGMKKERKMFLVLVSLHLASHTQTQCEMKICENLKIIHEWVKFLSSNFKKKVSITEINIFVKRELKRVELHKSFTLIIIGYCVYREFYSIFRLHLHVSLSCELNFNKICLNNIKYLLIENIYHFREKNEFN